MIVKVSATGQVTIPARVRRFLEISEHSEVDFDIHHGQVILQKLKAKTGASSDPIQKSQFSKLRGILKDKAPSTDEWLQATRGD